MSDEISDRIARLAKELADGAARAMAEAYTGQAAAGFRGQGSVAATQEAIVLDHFTQGNAARYKWPPLSPEYAKWKAKRFPRRPQNVLTFRLKNSIVGHGTIAVMGRVVSIRWRVPAYADRLIEQGRHPAWPDALDVARMVEVGRKWKDRKIKSLGLTKQPTRG